MKPSAVLSFDLEFWYNSKFLRKYLSAEQNVLGDYVEESVEPILNLLKKYNHKATFFILGTVAEKYPLLVKKISDLGHEIGSHGYSHKPLWELNKETFEEEIRLSKNILENITHKQLLGFRAPNCSLTPKTKWALEVLEKYNFKYDSSLHPLKFYKITNQLLEIPPSLGGIYFRIIPLRLYVLLIKYFSRGEIPVIFLHPNELFTSAPQINSAPWIKRKIKYYGTKGAFKKFEKLLQYFKFDSIENAFLCK